MKKAIMVGLVVSGLILGVAAGKVATRDPRGDDGTRGGQAISDEIGARGGQLTEQEEKDAVRGGQLLEEGGRCKLFFEGVAIP